MATTPLIPKIPPIRTDIQEPQQSSAVNRPPAQGASNGANTASNGGKPQHRTSKEWYYYWKKVGDQVVQNTQTLAGLVTYGPHASRPDPSTMPDGALAVDSDRGVIYQKQLVNGVPTWVYIAGTMWGTLSPDQRPTDLGAKDAGFEFRTTDEPPREFVWSQAAWIETTPVRYGTHAERLAVNVATVIEQMLWVETDRTVLYQLMAVSGGTPAWQYIAGTMWGTLSPDQRPTDLGTHDAGFEFRGTDQQREFIWSQAAWVETTPVAGASNLTHPNVVTKVTAAGTIGEGSITDAGAADANFVYIASSGNVGIGTGTNTSYPLHLVRAESSPNAAGIQQFAIGSNASYPTYNLAIGYGNPGIGANIGAIQAQAGGGSAQLVLQPSGGAVGINYTSPGYALQLGSDSAGKPSTSTWAIVSDIRTKRNVYPFEGDMEVIRKLEPVVGEYNGLGGTPEGARVVGFDAAKLRAIVPQCVSGVRRKLRETDAEETEILGVNIHEILFHMLRAVQQVDRRLSALEARP